MGRPAQGYRALIRNQAMQNTGGVEPIDILIAGTGALATLFAWRLARAGHRPILLGRWQPGVSALREKGARLVDSRGEEQAMPVRVVEEPEDCRAIKQVLVLVKSWQTARVAEELSRCISPDGLAVTLQNGLGNYEVLREE